MFLIAGALFLIVSLGTIKQEAYKMANTITDLVPDLLEALDTVSHELTGMIPSVSSDMTFQRAAVGQTVRSPVAPAAAAGDIAPGVTPPDDGNQVIGNKDMTIAKSRRVPIRWNGEQSLGINNSGGVTRSRIMQDQFAQAMRTLTNEVESDLTALHVNASRAYGTVGTIPFTTAGDFTDASFVAKILKDNGAPLTGNRLVLNTTSSATMIGKQSRMDIAGQDSILRQGVLLDTAGFSIRESAQIATAGTNVVTGVVTATGVEPIGETTINMTTAAGAGIIAVAGDIITFAGDTNKYVIAAPVTIGASTTGDVVIAEPGLLAATAGAEAVTGYAATARNMAFSPSAIVLATRAPALPEEGDLATDRQIITDPRSGLSFEVSKYMQYRQVQYEIALAWGVKVVKDEHLALLIG